MPNAQLNIQTPTGMLSVPINAGAVLMIAGPNGVGKSSLLHFIGRGLVHLNAEIFSGHRQIHFSTDDIEQTGMTYEQLYQNMFQQNNLFGRTRSALGEQHLKSVIKRIIQRQNQDNDDLVSKSEETGIKIAKLSIKMPRIVTVINRVFRAARLSVEIVMSEGIIKAEKDGQVYGVNDLSDGERAALLIVGAILVRPKNSFIAIDEPERHLNPSIAGPLINAAVRERADLGFIFATHDLTLIESLKPETVLHLENSSIVQRQPEVRAFKVNLITLTDDLPDDLRAAILGTRRAALVVEGETTSDDRALYSYLFPDRYIVPRGGADSVAASVRALRTNNQYHWLQVTGLIDGDGRDLAERKILSEDGIWALSCPAIENVFLQLEVFKLMADASFALFGGTESKQRVMLAKNRLSELMNQERSRIVSRQVVWSANRKLAQLKISVKEADTINVIEGVDVAKIRSDSIALFNKIVAQSTPFKALSSLPIKNTPIPNELAKIAGYNDFKSYKVAVIQQLKSNPTISDQLRSALIKLLPEIPPVST